MPLVNSHYVSYEVYGFQLDICKLHHCYLLTAVIWESLICYFLLGYSIWALKIKWKIDYYLVNKSLLIRWDRINLQSRVPASNFINTSPFWIVTYFHWWHQMCCTDCLRWEGMSRSFSNMIPESTCSPLPVSLLNTGPFYWLRKIFSASSV